MKYILNTSKTHSTGMHSLARLFAMGLTVSLCAFCGSANASDDELEQFKSAWNAAKTGDHASFNQIKNTLQDYALFPYLQYEDYRNRRASVPVKEMSAFLNSHEDWAFTAGLRSVWLKSLAERERWADLVAHSAGVSDTVLRCQRVRGQIILKLLDGVLSEAQKLWTVGKSQPDECNPVFAWLAKNNGITESLAWERIRLSIITDNPGMIAYLARFVPANQRIWLDQWQKLRRAGYSSLEQARDWPDNEITRMITATSLQSLARKDAARAAKKFQLLDAHFSWDETLRIGLLRDIALYSAVDLDDDTPANMALVPLAFRDSQLLEWWARFLLSRQDWSGLTDVIAQMPENTRNDDRWHYWLAQAGLRSGQVKPPSKSLEQLARKANYYGFLAADELGLAYNICPREPSIDADEVESIASIDGFARALELRKAGLDSWAIEEWSLAVRRLPLNQMSIVAALANRENWHDRAIFALGDSGDLDFYTWRFPLLWEADVKHEAEVYQLDPAWIYGTMRSESALVETARSSANALGLMQVTPATARKVAEKHGLSWNGANQLQTAAGNLPIGTAYIYDLLQDFRHNPVLVSGAYNAGPNAVQRWLDTRPLGEAAIWVETLPYFETRDYIPRVLAFTTIYDWRMNGKVLRISVRMPHIESGRIRATGSTGVACLDQS